MIKLVTKNNNVSLTTGGIPQSEMNDLLLAQEEKLNKEHQEEIDNINEAHKVVVDGLNTDINDLSDEISNLNTNIDNLETEVNELQAIVDNMPVSVEGVRY